MNWKTRLWIWMSMSVPAFTGFPVNRFPVEIVGGIGTGWLVYGILSHCLIAGMTGSRRYAWILTVTVWITLPVVFGGALISGLFHPVQMQDVAFQAARGAHYLRLCILMMTVIPLALGLVAIIPFGQIEQNILFRKTGLSSRHVRFLMFLRVFTHILYSVIPNVLDVLREEGMIRNHRHHPDIRTPGLPLRRRWLLHLNQAGLWVACMRHVSIQCICASVQHIPLWAGELSRISEYRSADGPSKPFQESE